MINMKIIHGINVLASLVEQVCTITGAVLSQGVYCRHVESHIAQPPFVLIL
jgi:hypothetical protein